MQIKTLYYIQSVPFLIDNSDHINKNGTNYCCNCFSNSFSKTQSTIPLTNTSCCKSCSYIYSVTFIWIFFLPSYTSNILGKNKKNK